MGEDPGWLDDRGREGHDIGARERKGSGVSRLLPLTKGSWREGEMEIGRKEL